MILAATVSTPPFFLRFCVKVEVNQTKSLSRFFHTFLLGIFHEVGDLKLAKSDLWEDMRYESKTKKNQVEETCFCYRTEYLPWHLRIVSSRFNVVDELWNWKCTFKFTQGSNESTEYILEDSSGTKVSQMCQMLGEDTWLWTKTSCGHVAKPQHNQKCSDISFCPLGSGHHTMSWPCPGQIKGISN